VRIPTEKAHGLQIMKMCEAFTQAGIELELILPCRKNPKHKDSDPFDLYRLKSRFKIVKLPIIDPVWLLKLRQGTYIKFELIFYLIPLFIYLFFKKNKSQYILYTRDCYLLPLLELFSKEVVWEVHDLPKRKNFYLKYLQACHMIIAITNGLNDELVRLGVAADKILVAPDGVDLEDFEKITEDQATIRKKLDLPLDKKIIMYAGHLYDWKGADILAEAAGNFSGNELFVFVGGTEREVAEFKSKFGNNGNILIVGQVNHELIAYYLKAADILVLPNSGKKVISRLYTSPMKLFEYLAAGKPIVASDLPSIREILSDQNSCLVEPDSAEALAAGLKKILSDPVFAGNLGKRSFLEARAYSWDLRAKSILKYL
jgi:glycosyltransferase involved in cell wall biosynthesis